MRKQHFKIHGLIMCRKQATMFATTKEKNCKVERRKRNLSVMFIVSVTVKKTDKDISHKEKERQLEGVAEESDKTNETELLLVVNP